MRRDIRAVLERWGRWAAHEENRSDWPTVCATFRGVLPHKSSLRPSCCDDDGMAVDACVSQLHRAGADNERAVPGVTALRNRPFHSRYRRCTGD
ncbi:hypothetical protein ABL142_005309 [Salmonella enterica]